MPWYEVKERGSLLGIRITLWMARTLGYTSTRAFVGILSLYFTIFSPHAVRNIREFLSRATGRDSWAGARLTIRNFAESMLDRAFVIMGRAGIFRLETFGEEEALALHHQGRGYIVMGAHLGVLEMARAFNLDRKVAFSMLIYSEPSSGLYREFKRLSPDMERAMIHIVPDSFEHVLIARERILAGEIVGVLADRAWMHGDTLSVPFLGRNHLFPTGPHALVTAIKCPVFLVFLVKTGPRDYTMHFERWATPEDLPDRTKRAEWVIESTRKYADTLEHYARKYPHQWYNFHDFWEGRTDQLGPDGD